MIQCYFMGLLAWCTQFVLDIMGGGGGNLKGRGEPPFKLSHWCLHTCVYLSIHISMYPWIHLCASHTGMYICVCIAAVRKHVEIRELEHKTASLWWWSNGSHLIFLSMSEMCSFTTYLWNPPPLTIRCLVVPFMLSK